MQTNSIARSGNVQSQERLHQNIRTHGTHANSNPGDSVLADSNLPDVRYSEAHNVSVQEGGGRMFKFVVSGPKPQNSVFSTVVYSLMKKIKVEHARFSAPFVKKTSNGVRVSAQAPSQVQQPVPNPRRSTGGNMGTTGSTGSSEANKMIYSENKPNKPQPRIRRKSAGDLIEAAPAPNRKSRPAVNPQPKTWNPPKPDPKKAPLITSNFNPSDIKRYSPTPIAETEPVYSPPKGRTYQQQLDEFRERSPRSSGLFFDC